MIIFTHDELNYILWCLERADPYNRDLGTRPLWIKIDKFLEPEAYENES